MRLFLFLIPVMLFMIPSSDAAIADSCQARQQIDVFIQREDIKSRLETMGINQEEASARVQALSDSEAVQFAGKIETAPAGKGVLTLFEDLILLLANFFIDVINTIF